MIFTRFDYSTGDAAGQNMVSRATFIACEWINQQRPEMLHYMLSGNFDTEKKTSSVNLLKTRGKRVTAEITIPRDILMKHLRVAPEQIAYGQQISTLSAILTNSSNNANHPANALAALYSGDRARCREHRRIESMHHLSASHQQGRLLFFHHAARRHHGHLRRRHVFADSARVPENARLRRSG